MTCFSLYIHIPYCQAKCPYCDFNSHAATRWPEGAYTAALVAELEHYAAQPAWCGRIDTIFFGGGTPSLFAPESIARLLDAAFRLWPFASTVDSRQSKRNLALNSQLSPLNSFATEVTLEANPGTVTPEKLHGFRAAGINRMSFGVQSFEPHHLQRLGRIHSAGEAVAAIELARRAGFTNVSADLIFALPNQTLGEWESDLRQACALGPEHISAYNLTYEEGTAFHQWRAQGTLQQLPEEIEVAMFTRSQEVLGAAGYQQYEISNYARPGFMCRHNLNYWQGGPYLGVGAGAHSYQSPVTNALIRRAPVHPQQSTVDSLNGGGMGTGNRELSTVNPSWGFRWSNEKSPSAYIEAVQTHGHARCSSETLDERQARGEFVFLGLRCRDGFSAGTFRDRFAAEFATAFPHAMALRDDGLLQCSDDRWRLTPRGLLVADSVFATFL
jgi:oxygen-independent coproporphyrinogen-3 oxidase